PAIKAAMERWKDDEKVDGLLLNYLHFYGSYDFVGDAYSWYRREIRIIRSSKNIFSYKDAQGFRKNEDEKLRVKPIDAWVYHYGWVRPPKVMQQKHRDIRKFYTDDDAWIAENLAKQEEYDYSAIDALKPFTGTHPAVMQERILRLNWRFDH